MTPIKRPPKRHCIKCRMLDWLDRVGYCEDCALAFALGHEVYYWDHYV